MKLTRRQFAKGGAAALVSTSSLGFAISAFGKPKDAAALLKDAEQLYKELTVIDFVSSVTPDDAGIQIVKNCGITCFSPTLGVRRPDAPGEGTYMLRAFPLEAAVEDCVATQKWIEQFPNDLVLALNTADITQAKRDGKAAVLINFQNAPIEDRLDNIDMFYGLGLRSMQVTYNERNLLGDGSTERTNAGLSDFGIAAVKRMNELGILVDSSHSGYQTTMDAIQFSERTPIISHSNCAALNPHPRAKTDEQIRALAAKGGVMGITNVNIMVKKDLPVTIEHFIDHIEHVVKLVGVDHVGFGSDSAMSGWDTDPEKEELYMKVYYGPHLFKDTYGFRYPLAVEGMNDEYKWKSVTAGLLKRGYSDTDIGKIVGGNWLRVFSEVIG
jgi:membrane dipeptidase